MNRHQELLALVQSFEPDFHKFFDKNNSSAGTRVRKAMADLKRKAQEIRQEVQDMKKNSKAEAAPAA
jgi:vacuolar-type H+-ATPase catalytic subunit A/Vma1